MNSGAASSIIGGGAGNIHIFVFTDLNNNRFQNKLIMQNTSWRRRAGGEKLPCQQPMKNCLVNNRFCLHVIDENTNSLINIIT
jgi:hypothetical protein